MDLLPSRSASPVGHGISKHSSIILIGQTGVGKTTIAGLIGAALRRPVIPISSNFHNDGYNEFAEQILKHKSDTVIDVSTACLRDERCLAFLHRWTETQNGLVIQLIRGQETEPSFRNKTDDPERPTAHRGSPLPDQPEFSAQLERAASFVFAVTDETLERTDTRMVTRGDSYNPAWPNLDRDVSRFLRFIRGTYTNHVNLQSSSRSYCLALTFDRMSRAIPVLNELAIGVECWEVRADLLADRRMESIVQQIGLLRRYSDLPIILSSRTVTRGGKLAEPEDDPEVLLYMFQVCMIGLKLGVEYVDISSVLPDTLRDVLIARKGHTRIIASRQDFQGTTSWTDLVLKRFYCSSTEAGADIVMIVNADLTGNTIDDNMGGRKFAKEIQQQVPLIAFNIGHAGKLSRVLNTHLTPVSHALLPTCSAPGQLTYLETQQILHLTSLIVPQSLYLFGNDLDFSLGPMLHNATFRLLGLPYSYTVCDRPNVDSYVDVIRSVNFGGASVTSPYKLAAIEMATRLTHHAAQIGAINTLITTPNGITGENTDWRGIYRCVIEQRQALRGLGSSPKVLIIGAGGVARAAIYAAVQLGLTRVDVMNRSQDRAVKTVQDLRLVRSDLQLTLLKDLREATKDATWFPPDIVISTIPQMDPLALAAFIPLSVVFAKPKGIFLDMAYGPSRVSPMTAALHSMIDKSWLRIEGCEVFLEQACEQIRVWTGKRAPRTHLDDVVRRFYGE